jgi:hypothetical protein
VVPTLGSVLSRSGRDGARLGAVRSSAHSRLRLPRRKETSERMSADHVVFG